MLKKIIICGNYGATNLGDELIVDNIIKSIKKEFPEIEITVMSANPEETTKKYNVKSVHFIPAGFRSFLAAFSEFDFFKTINAIQKADLFILGGGGLFTDEKLHAVIIWYIQVLFASLFKKKIYIYANSIGPLNTKIGKKFTQKALKKAEVITVRDKDSKEVAISLGISNKTVEVTADPAFLIEKSSKILRRKNCIIISLRPFLNITEKLIEDIPQFLKYLIEAEKLDVYLFPFQTIKDDDKKLFKDIKDKTGNSKKIQLIEPTLDFKKVIKLFSEAKYVVGMRLHSLILSTITKTPFISISYSKKCSSYLKEINYQDAEILPEKLNRYLLEQKFGDLKRNYNKIQGLLEKQSEILKIKAEKNVRFLDFARNDY